MIKLISKSSDETIKIGYKLALNFKGDEVVILNGDLASGKTTITKGIAQAIDVKNIITSPTFVICKEYVGKFNLYHLDLYRLNELGEDFNLMDYFNQGIVVIEWPYNVKELVPNDYIEISFKTINEYEREILIKGTNLELDGVVSAAFSS